MTSWTLEYVLEHMSACSLCHGHLVKRDDNVLVCRGCGKTFPIQYGIPCMQIGEQPEPLAFEVEWHEKTEGDRRKHKEGHYLAHGKARRVILEALKQLGANESWTVLSVATGAGTEIPLIEQISKRIVGTDLALIALRRFMAKFPYPLFQADARRLPFRDKAFDACVVSGLLHHIVGHDNLVPYLTEFRRVLRVGGALVAVEPNSLYPVQWIMGPLNRLVQRVRPGWRGLVPHERPISPGFIVQRMRDAGFSDLRYTGATFLHNRLPASVCRILDSWEDKIRKKAPFRLFAWWTAVTARRETL